MSLSSRNLASTLRPVSLAALLALAGCVEPGGSVDPAGAPYGPAEGADAGPGLPVFGGGDAQDALAGVDAPVPSDAATEPDVGVPPCGADGLCDEACEDDPDCPPETDPCGSDGSCNTTDCAVGEDPDCDTGASCVEDGVCDPQCWETDPDCGCAALGIATHWAGTFEGVIPYEFIFNAGSGDQYVDGSLAFQIDCLAAKYIVQGDMTGAEDNGVPFSVTLSGSYDPFAQFLSAEMKDGVVMLLPGFAEITFEGIFEGTLIGGDHFEGTWSGESTGGLAGVLTATGSGTWQAFPQ